MIYAFSVAQYHLFYRGFQRFQHDDRLLLLYQISLLRPAFTYYSNGICINPSKLMMKRRHPTKPFLGNTKSQSGTTSRTEAVEESKSEPTSDDEFEITSSRQDYEIDYVPRDVPACHFAEPTEANNVFIKMQKGKTRFMIIKSDNVQDFYSAINASVWSSTPRGNRILDAAYDEWAVRRRGHVYLFFSANGTGHISAFGELISK